MCMYSAHTITLGHTKPSINTTTQKKKKHVHRMTKRKQQSQTNCESTSQLSIDNRFEVFVHAKPFAVTRSRWILNAIVRVRQCM